MSSETTDHGIRLMTVARIGMTLAVALCWIAPARGQTANTIASPTSESTATSAAEQPSETASPLVRPILPLPPALPDGRPLRPVAIFLSQMDELIPDGFRPVSVTQLNEAIERQLDRATDDRTSRLKSAVYWIDVRDDMLVSNRSTIELESDRPTEVRRTLGRVNLAIEPPTTRVAEGSAAAIPRLESEADGSLVAVFRGGTANQSKIDFQWKLPGQPLGFGREFTIQLPRTPQTRLVISAPEATTVQALDGVLKVRPDPPQDADEFAADRPLRWYELDAGGLSQVRLRTRVQQQVEDRRPFVVRRSSLQYEIDPAGVTWICRMVVQPPLDLSMPALQVADTVVTSIKVNASDVPFTSRSLDNHLQELQVEMPLGMTLDESIALSVTIAGYSSWSAQSGWCDLPNPIWTGQETVDASAVNDVQLAVRDPLRVTAWQLPMDWKQSPQQRLESGVTICSAEGPPIIRTEDPSTAASLHPWSRVRLAEVPAVQSGDCLLRLEVGTGVLSAKARLEVDTVSPNAGPIQLQIEPSWSVENVTYVRSGRVVEFVRVNEQSPILDLWPEVEDVDQGRLVMELKGSRALPPTNTGLVIPSTWFARILNVRTGLLAAIVPPADLNWSGEAALERGRIKTPELTAEQQEFYEALSPETLWFQPDTSRTPSLVLQTPSISYDAVSVLEIQSDGGDVVEQLTVAVASESQNLKQLVVYTGAASGRPDLTWSVTGTDGGPAINLPSADVIVGRGEEDGVQTIDVSETDLRGRKLTGQRRYPMTSAFRLPLPGVPGAASQNCEILIGPTWVVQDRPKGVQLVPLIGETQGQESAKPTAESSVDLKPRARATRRGWTRLRYDAVEQPTISLSKVQTSPEAAIIWHEQIRVIASSRGTDRIEATYHVAPDSLIQIEADADLQLVSLLRDGVPVELGALPQRPLVLPPRFASEVIQVTWDRSLYGSGWVRDCRIPRVRIAGSVLRSELILQPSADTFAPAALLAGQDGALAGIRTGAGERVILLRRNTAIALGWLMSMLMFSFGWYVAIRSPLGVAALVVLATAGLVLWWPWRLAVIGWMIVPLLAAAILATSDFRSLRWARSSDGRPRGWGLGYPRSPTRDASSDLSIKPSARAILPWLLIALALWQAQSTAQESTPAASVDRNDAVDVLVPVLETGELSGEMVYIRREIFAELFPATGPHLPREPRFLSADYRVRINSAASSADQLIFSAVEAEYQIVTAENDPKASLVRLPLAASAIRRIESIDEAVRIVPFEADAMGQAVAALPRGNASRVRVTLRPMVSQSGDWTRLFLNIPPVAASRLTVESEQNVDAIRVGGASGRIVLEERELLRRWVEDLGPTRTLEVDVRVAAGGREPQQALGRRYWIHAGRQNVTIDCEVDPPGPIAAGEAFQFVVRDSTMPSVVSPSWRFRGSELYSPTRRLITLESIRDNPEPIHLLWIQSISSESAGTTPAAPIRIPEVIAAALGENSNAWIALHSDPSLQLAPAIREQIEPLSVDQFLAAWKGYRGRIDRAFVPVGEIPSILLQTASESEPQIEQTHHLNVLPVGLELFYSATLIPSQGTRRFYRLNVPSSMELTRLTINDVEVLTQPAVSNQSGELLLGDFVGTEPVRIEAVAVGSLAAKDTFSPPRFSVLPPAITVEEYRLSRNRSVNLKVVERPSLDPDDSNPKAQAESLANGWIPVSTWSGRFEPDAKFDFIPGGVFELVPRTTRFDCDQLIVMSRSEAQWSMEMHVRFGRQVPEYVDVEVPIAWCDNLEVNPPMSFSRQQGIDPAKQIVRIRSDKSDLVDGTFSIRGQLTNAASGRVSVPSVRILGMGQRRIHVSVPSRLEKEPVQWRTSAVEGDPLPDRWRGKVETNQRQTYLVANPSWSIDLAPLPEIDAAPFAVGFDAQTFPQTDGVLVLCHWDLFPGTLDAIEVQLPSGSHCVGAWSAGKAVVPSLDAARSSVRPDAGILRVPLALSRLSQPVEILVRVPTEATRQTGFLPELIGVPVSNRWLTHYLPDDQSQSRWGRTFESDQERALSLATAVMKAMESVGFMDQRPREEVVSWLRLWFARYKIIAASAARPGLSKITANSSALAPQTLVDRQSTETSGHAALPSHLQWQQLDAQMAAYAERFLPGESLDLSQVAVDDVFLFAVGDFAGFHPGRSSRLDAARAIESLQPVLDSDRGLRSLILNGLTLLLLAGLLLCLRPFAKVMLPIVSHPATWLACLGFFGFAVAPIPVAAALILVAVALPIFPRGRRSYPMGVR